MPEAITQDILYHCTYDDTEQPARIYRTSEPQRPLLLMLHQWEWGYAHVFAPELEQWCADNDWNLICPHFRGPGWESLSCGHEAAQQDILDAVDHALNDCQADPENVYVVAPTGGNIPALLLAASHPEKWKAMSLWNPVADLRAWHSQEATQATRIPQEIREACYGNPTTNPAAEASAIAQSPLTYLQPNLTCSITINAGIKDGHDGPVPISHACQIFNALILPEDRIPTGVIATMTDKGKIPEDLACQEEIPGFAPVRVLFHKTADDTTINIFDGGHEILPQAIIQWLQTQQADNQ